MVPAHSIQLRYTYLRKGAKKCKKENKADHHGTRGVCVCRQVGVTRCFLAGSLVMGMVLRCGTTTAAAAAAEVRHILSGPCERGGGRQADSNISSSNGIILFSNSMTVNPNNAEQRSTRPAHQYHHGDMG
jgi:hypothetical protein